MLWDTATPGSRSRRISPLPPEIISEFPNRGNSRTPSRVIAEPRAQTFSPPRGGRHPCQIATQLSQSDCTKESVFHPPIVPVGVTFEKRSGRTQGPPHRSTARSSTSGTAAQNPTPASLCKTQRGRENMVETGAVVRAVVLLTPRSGRGSPVATGGSN
jgi:hypothetical protein